MAEMQTLLVSSWWHAVKECLSRRSKNCLHKQGKLLFNGQDAAIWVHGKHRAKEGVQ